MGSPVPEYLSARPARTGTTPAFSGAVPTRQLYLNSKLWVTPAARAISSSLAPAVNKSMQNLVTNFGGGGGGGYSYGYGGYSGPTQQQKDAAEQTKALYKEGANTTYNAALDNFKTLNEQWGLNDSMAQSQWRTADVAADRNMFDQEKKQQSMASRALNSMGSGVGSLLDTFTQANKRYNDTWKGELKGNLLDNWNSIENNRLSANSNIWQQMENLSSETKAKLKGYGIDLTGAISNIHSDLAKDYFSGGNVNWNAADLKYINDLISKIDLQRREKPEANYRWWINPPGENFTQSGGSVLNAMGNINPEWQRKSSVGYDNRKALGE